MENLFYSLNEKILFYVAGYTDNTANVKGIISMFQNNYDFFYKICGVKELNTLLVEKSSRYRGMRIFYCTTDNPPSDAFKLNIERTMKEWLTD